MPKSILMLWRTAFLAMHIFAAPMELTLSENAIDGWLQRKEGWKPSSVIAASKFLSLDQNRVFVFYTSTEACGTGLCPQYLFEQTGTGRWRWIGNFNGRVEVLKSTSHGLYDLRCTARLGGFPEELDITELKYNGNRYVESSP